MKNIEFKCYACGKKITLASIEERMYIMYEDTKKELKTGGGAYIASIFGANSVKDQVCDSCWTTRYLDFIVDKRAKEDIINQLRS